MSKPPKRLQKGFTIIELMVATTVFSLILMVCLASFIQVSRMFYKGYNMARTQEATRMVAESIADDIRFAQLPPTVPAPDYFCVGLHRYKFDFGNHMGDAPWDLATNYGIVRENIVGGCPSPTIAGSGSAEEEMLTEGMQLNRFNVSCANKRCLVDIHVVFYGVETDVFTPSATDSNAQCTGSLSGSQYCATATFTNTILQSL